MYWRRWRMLVLLSVRSARTVQDPCHIESLEAAPRVGSMQITVLLQALLVHAVEQHLAAIQLRWRRCVTSWVVRRLGFLLEPELDDGLGAVDDDGFAPVSYTHLRAHETPEHLVCRLL